MAAGSPFRCRPKRSTSPSKTSWSGPTTATPGRRTESEMAPRFIVDARGQLVAEDAQAKQALSAKAGQFFLAPTSPDLLFFFRTPAVGEQSGSSRVGPAGGAAALPVSVLVALFVHTRRARRVPIPAPGA